jgi:hypothetical protein
MSHTIPFAELPMWMEPAPSATAISLSLWERVKVRDGRAIVREVRVQARQIVRHVKRESWTSLVTDRKRSTAIMKR